MSPLLNTIIIYARDMQRTAAFYERYFGFITTGEVIEGLIELAAPEGGASILIHQAAKSVKLGQVGVNRVERGDGRSELLGHIGSVEMQPGDVFVVETPGGGGYGAPDPGA